MTQKEFNPKYGDIIVCENGKRYICASAEEVLEKVGSNPKGYYPNDPIYAYGETQKKNDFMTWDKSGEDGGFSIKEVISMNKKQPHKHAELIKAWADGAVIQVRTYDDDGDSSWHDVDSPHWSIKLEYRVKPEPKLDVKKYIVLGKGYNRLYPPLRRDVY